MIVLLFKKTSKYKYIIYIIYLYFGVKFVDIGGCVIKLSDIMIVLSIYDMPSENLFLCINVLRRWSADF